MSAMRLFSPLLRSLLVIAGVLVGLVVAALTEGRMVHLRAVAGGALPPWTVAIDAEAGLWRGRMRILPEPGAARHAEGGGQEVHWQGAPSWRGMTLHLQLRGPGAQISALAQGAPAALVRARLANADNGPVLVIDRVRGAMSPQAVLQMLRADARAAGALPQLQLDITDGTARFDLGTGRLVEFRATGRVIAAGFGGHDLGAGHFTAASAPDGGWQLSATVAGEDGQSRISAAGRHDSPSVALEMTLPDALTAPVPQGWDMLPDGRADALRPGLRLQRTLIIDGSVEG